MTNHDTYILYTIFNICANHLVYSIWRQLKISAWLSMTTGKTYWKLNTVPCISLCSFLWKWWISTPLTEMNPREVTWSTWMKTTLILTQEEVRDEPFIYVVILKTYEKDGCWEEQEGNPTSPSAAELLSSWQHNTAVVLGSSQVCVSNTPSPAATPSGSCRKLECVLSQFA